MKLRGMVVVCLVACGGGGGGGGGDDAPVIDAPIDAPVGKSMIGPAGGAVASMDGVATLTIPAGALTMDVEITIDAVAQVPASIVPASPIGAVYAIGPEGTVFAVPATLEWRFATTPAGSKDASNRPRVLFGYARSASDVIEGHVDTEARHSGTSLTVTSKLSHLSEHFLTAKAFARNPPLFVEVGSVVVELGGGPGVRRAVGNEWTAKKVELHPTDLNSGRLFILTDGEAPISEVEQKDWMQSNKMLEGYLQNVTLTAGTTFVPSSLPKYTCTSPGVGKVWMNVYLDVFIVGVGGRGNVWFEEPVECYDREQKPEYTVEAGLLGMTRIAPLAVPGTTTVNLADHQGLYGHQVCLLPGQTIRVCVGASMPTAVNYFPQYPPGFTFVDGAPGSGCVTITNLDPNDANCVLVKSDGGGSPNNVTVTTTIP